MAIKPVRERLHDVVFDRISFSPGFTYSEFHIGYSFYSFNTGVQDSGELGDLVKQFKPFEVADEPPFSGSDWFAIVLSRVNRGLVAVANNILKDLDKKDNKSGLPVITKDKLDSLVSMYATMSPHITVAGPFLDLKNQILELYGLTREDYDSEADYFNDMQELFEHLHEIKDDDLYEGVAKALGTKLGTQEEFEEALHLIIDEKIEEYAHE